MRRREYLLETKDFEYAIIDPINPKFVPEPLDAEDFQKFNPNHDELGRFATSSGMSGSTAESIIARTQANGGLSVRMISGREPRGGYMVATSNAYSQIVEASDFYDRKKGIKILADYAKANKSRLVDGKYYLGLWHNEGQVYLDVSEHVMDRTKAVSEGRVRNQKSIWDVTNFEEIDTGGSGVDVQKGRSDSDSRGYFDDDGRGYRRVGGEGIRRVGFVPFAKFNANHDELGRFASSSSGASSTDYQMAHRPQGIEGGAPLHDLTGGGEIYPADVYSAQGAQYYGTGYKALDVQAHAMIQKFRGKPDAPVTIYRAIPKDATQTNINAGDWVTPIREYAVQHGQSNLNSDYKILSKTVRAKEIFTSGDSWMEWGYSPSATKVIKFEAGLIPVLKYNQNHDAKTGEFTTGVGSGSVTFNDSAFNDAYKGFSISDAEKRSLEKYQNTEYRYINGALRKGGDPSKQVGTLGSLDDSNKSHVDNLDAMIARAPHLESETPIYRVFSQNAVKGLVSGQTFEDKGYMSASLHDLSVPENGKIRSEFAGLKSGSPDVAAKIHLNGHYSGLHINSANFRGEFAGEREFLLPRGSQLQYLGTEKAPSGETILNFKRING